MKKIVVLLLFIVTGITTINAQFQVSRLTFGGGLGVQFGDYTLVNIAPQVGYDFNKYLNAGAGFTYTYFNDKYDGWKQTNNYLGFNVYGKVYPIPYIVLLVQPEINRMWQTIENRANRNKTKKEEFVPVFLVGGGVRLGPITAMIQYDVAQDDNSPYGNRLFYSLGYTFSF